jgi:hypothetical protein
MTGGVIILLVDALALIYVSTSGVKRHFERMRSSHADLSPVGF